MIDGLESFCNVIAIHINYDYAHFDAFDWPEINGQILTEISSFHKIKMYVNLKFQINKLI